MIRKLALATAGVVAIGAIALLWGGRSASGSERIVFQANVNGLHQLFTIKPDGSELTQITHLAVPNSGGQGAEDPAWSPDGKRILFDADYQKTTKNVLSLFTIKPDGSDLKRVPLALGPYVGEATYAPDGKLIAFDWDEGASGPHPEGIEIATADGGSPYPLTWTDVPNVLHMQPAWSPDGKWILVTEKRGELSAIHRVRFGSAEAQVLTPWALAANNGAWSPDGTRVAFNSNNDVAGANANLYIMKADGTGRAAITHYTGGKLNAHMGGWSPDGKHVVFQLRGPDPKSPGVNQLFIVDADGSNIRQLTHLPHGMDPGHASWGRTG